MTTIRSLSLRVFPSRTRCTYAVTWRTQRGADTTDRRLYWGDVPISYSELDAYEPVQLLAAVVQDLERRNPIGRSGGAGPGALEGGGGGSEAGSGLPGIDTDD